MVKVAYTSLKMLISSLKKAASQNTRLFPTDLQASKKMSISSLKSFWLSNNSIMSTSAFPILFQISTQPNSTTKEKTMKKILSISVLRMQRAREIFSSPTTFFFFIFLLKRGHIFALKTLFLESQDRNGWGPLDHMDLWRLPSTTSLLKARSPRPGCCGSCSAEFLIYARTETPQPLWVTCACVRTPSK